MSVTDLTSFVMELHRKTAIVLPRSVKDALELAYQREDNEIAKGQLETIRKNISIAEERSVPVCQDTGIPIFFIKKSKDFDRMDELKESLVVGTEKATKAIPIRENVIHPLTKANKGTNTGWGMPFVYYDLHDEPYTEVTLLLKGFGSEAKTSLAYFPTSVDVEKGIIKFVLECVRKALGEPCPPYIIGIGAGGTSDIAAYLAKKAFMRLPLGKACKDEHAAALEKKILDAVNATGVGPMGFGGKTTALAVHMEICGTHTGAVPVVVAFQCWADRQATGRLYPDGTFKILEEE